MRLGVKMDFNLKMQAYYLIEGLCSQLKKIFLLCSEYFYSKNTKYYSTSISIGLH